MKLKYILPVATIASVATIVTPLVTSCGKNTNSYTYEHDKSFTPLNPRKAMVVKDNDDLTEKYHADLLKNKGIFANDIVNVIGGLDGESDQVITKVTYTTTDVSKEMETWTNPDTNETVKFFRVSFDVYMDATIKMMGFPVEFKQRTASVKDLPINFEIRSDSGTEVCVNMSFGTTSFDLAKDDKWSANLPEAKDPTKGQGFIGDKNVDYNKESYADFAGQESLVLDGMLTKMIEIDPSNYYKLVTKA